MDASLSVGGWRERLRRRPDPTHERNALSLNPQHRQKKAADSRANTHGKKYVSGQAALYEGSTPATEESRAYMRPRSKPATGDGGASGDRHERHPTIAKHNGRCYICGRRIPKRRACVLMPGKGLRCRRDG